MIFLVVRKIREQVRLNLFPYLYMRYDVHRQLLTPINRAMSMGITHFLAILRGGFFYP